MKKLFLLALTSCSILLTEHNHATAQQRSTTSVANQKVDIYIAGWSKPNGTAAATYLKNGVPVVLCDSQTESEIASITVVNGDVYAAGRHSALPVYWKNGQEVALKTPNAKSGRAAGIAVYKGDVYVTGFEYVNKTNSTQTIMQARLWKNGVQMPMEITKDFESEALCMAIDQSNGDVYVAGADRGTEMVENNKWVYWKNGERKKIINNPRPVLPYRITISNGELYAVGWSGYQYGDVWVNKPAYWSNSTGTVILDKDIVDQGKAFSIALTESDIFVAGYLGYQGKYWKNGVGVELGGVTNYPNESFAAVNGRDFYITGLVSINGQDAYRLWKNGQVVQSFSMYVNDMVIVGGGNVNQAASTSAVNRIQPTAASTANKTPPGAATPIRPTQPAALTPKQEAEKFLAENKIKPGVITTPSGLQYEVLKNGNGLMPESNDRVKINYHGTLINGEIFDSTINRGAPVTTPLNNLLPGMKEGLQLMSVGSRYKLVVPPDLGFGKSGAGNVKPDAALIMEVELVAIVK